MGTLSINNVDEQIVWKYNNATQDEQRKTREVVSCWIKGEPRNLKHFIENNQEVKKDSLRREALEYAEKHPVFPLCWSENKLTREEMNER